MMIPFEQYFNSGQKIFIQRLVADQELPVLETMSGHVIRNRQSQLDIRLGHGTDAAISYPFYPGMEFEILTDSAGMGVRMIASFVKKLNNQDIRLKCEGRVEFFSKRICARIKVKAWVGVTRQQGAMSEMQHLWQQHIQLIESEDSAVKLPEFKKYSMDLAAGGMRLPLRSPVYPAELVMVYLSIGDKKGVICALTEVIWVGEAHQDCTQQCGLRFVNILEEDQERIEATVKSLQKRQKDNTAKDVSE